MVFIVEGDACDMDPRWGDAAEHGAVTFPQHPLEGEDLGPGRRPSSYRPEMLSVKCGNN